MAAARPDGSLAAGFDLFASLSGETVDAILALSHARRIPRDAAAFGQGEAAQEFLVLLSGRLKVVRTAPDGGQIGMPSAQLKFEPLFSHRQRSCLCCWAMIRRVSLASAASAREGRTLWPAEPIWVAPRH